MGPPPRYPADINDYDHEPASDTHSDTPKHRIVQLELYPHRMVFTLLAHDLTLVAEFNLALIAGFFPIMSLP